MKKIFIINLLSCLLMLAGSFARAILEEKDFSEEMMNQMVLPNLPADGQYGHRGPFGEPVVNDPAYQVETQTDGTCLSSHWNEDFVVDPSNFSIRDLDFSLSYRNITNRDGYPDLVWQHPDGRLFTYQLVSGIVINLQSLTSDLTGSRLWSIRNSGFQPMTPRFDRDDDGLNDLLFQNDDGRLVTWFMDSDVRLGAELHARDFRFDPAWRVAGVTDADGDGEEDFVWQHANGRIVIWRMDGNTYLGSSPVSHDVRFAPQWRIVGIGDINRDGLDDWVFQKRDVGGIIVWYMDGGQRIGSASISGSSSTLWRLAAVADMNSDGDPDFVWQNNVSGNLAAWYMDGPVNGQAVSFLNPISAVWNLESVHDLDHDGDPDLVFRHKNDGRTYAWYLNGITRVGAAPLSSASTSWDIRHSED